MKTSFCVGIVVALAIGGCAKSIPDPFTGRPAPSEKDQAKVSWYVEGLNDAGFKLLRKLADNKPAKNVLVSPYSAAQTLGMLGYATTGDTQKELVSFLRAPSSDDLAVGQYSLAWTLNQIPDRPFMSANAVISLKGNQVAAMPKLADRFLAEKFDEPDLPKLIQKTNEWASERTLGMIPKAVEKLDPDVVVALVNASAFSGTWETEFDPAKTRDLPFTLEGTQEGEIRSNIGARVSRTEGGRSIRVPTMEANKYRSQSHADSGGWTVAELPYASGDVSMVVALPQKGKPISEAVAGLNADRWKQITYNLVPHESPIFIPKFKFSQSHDLVPVVKSLGVKKPFEWSGDFQELVSVKGLAATTDVIQAVSIVVEEKGTKAAATTVAATATKGIRWSFNLNRPFVYAIVHNPTGAILFIGVCADPSQSD